MNRLNLSIGIFALGIGLNASANKISKEQYVDQWSKTAVKEMMQHGIPASITLAQGILESGSGNSVLAQEGNNHFGIKCHGWTGKKVYIDDDAKGECFRGYKDASESYVDHSEFLKKYERYQFLFSYDTDDYESWAKGLKKAGYATDPAYPDRLIKIIRDLSLDTYDKLSKPDIQAQPSLIASSSESKGMNAHSIEKKNDLTYVIVKKGDTFYSIAKEFGITMRQMRMYNDFDFSKDRLDEGEVIYIRNKKGRSIFKKEEITVDANCTLYELAQKTGVKASTIKKLNGFESERIDLKKGQKVILR